MKDKRGMFYSNYNMGGFNDNMPSPYQVNSNYMAYGPGVNPNMANMIENNEAMNDPYNERITKIERQIRSLDQRISKLENINNTSVDTDSNLYMI